MKPTDKPKPPDAAPAGPPGLPDTKEAQRVESRLLEIRSDYGEDTELRLRALYAIWRNPLGPKSLTKAQLDELIRFGIVKNDIQKPINDGLALQCSMQDLAAYLTEKYGKEKNKIYYAKEISAWTKIGMPKPGRNKLLNSQDCLRWFEANKLDDGKTSAGGYSIAEAEAAKRESIIIERNQKLHDYEESQRATNGKWILFASVKSYVAGMAAKLHGVLHKFVDDRGGLRAVIQEEGKATGISDELLLALDERLAARFPAEYEKLVEAEFRRTQADAVKHFEVQRKEQAKGTA